MPIMNGVEATTIIKNMMKNQEISHIPVIALSGDDCEKMEELSREGLFDGILQKPITEYQLKKIIDEIISD